MMCHPAAVSAPTYSAHCRAARSASTATRSACVTMPSASLLLGLRTSARIGIAVMVGTLGVRGRRRVRRAPLAVRAGADRRDSRYRANTSMGTFRKYLPVLGSRTDKALGLPNTDLCTSVITTVVPAFNVGP